MDREGIKRFMLKQAIYKAIASDVKTGVDGNSRAAFDDYYYDIHYATGATSFTVAEGDLKLGTVSVTPAKIERREKLEVTNDSALHDWAEENGFLVTIVDMPAVEQYFLDTGELPDGCTIVNDDKVTKEKVTLRVYEQNVLEVFRDELPAGVAGLLEG